MLDNLLAFEPSVRWNVTTALDHDYVAAYHDESDEPACPELFDKWEEVEALNTVEELREAITREIDEFRDKVRTFDPDDWEAHLVGETDGTIEIAERVEILSTVDTGLSPLSQQPPIVPTASSHILSSYQLHDSPRLSPRTQQGALGISPATSVTPTMPARTDISAPATPATATTALSEESSFGAPSAPHSGRSSRRTSGFYARRPTSWLFSSPLGGGMTPLPSMTHEASGSGSWSRKSRASSGISEVGSLRPLIRRLSTVDLGAVGPKDEDEVPPMTVSPSDAPPSEAPKSFGE